MENERDRFGEKMKLLERAKEDIYFAAKDLELIEKLRSVFKKVEEKNLEQKTLVCPKCSGKLETYTFMEFFLDRCQGCGGIWLDKGELEGILEKVLRAPSVSLVEWFFGKSEEGKKEGGRR